MLLLLEKIWRQCFVKRARRRIQQMDQAAEDLRDALDLPPEAKHELISLLAFPAYSNELLSIGERDLQEKEVWPEDTQEVFHGSIQDPRKGFSARARSRKKLVWFNTLAAVICVGILVGGLILMLRVAPQTSASPPSGLYVTTGDSVYRLATQNGHLKPLWHYTLHAPWTTQRIDRLNLPSDVGSTWNIRIDSSPTVVDTTVYFGGSEDDTITHQLHHYLYALDAVSGTLVWRYQIDENGNGIKGPYFTNGSGSGSFHLDLGKIISAPQVADGLVYIQIGSWPSYYILALDSGNGRVRWSYNYQGTSTYSQMSAVIDNRLYISVDNRLLALNAKSGQKQWVQQVPWQKGSSSFLSLQTANGTVYATFISYPGHQDVGSYSNAVHTSLIYAFDMASGLQRWVSKPIDGEVSPLVVDQQAVYLGSEAGYIYALKVTDGSQLWSYDYDPHASFVFLQKMDGVIYARETLSLYGLAAAQYNGPPPSLGIIALTAASGKVEWKNTIPRTVSGTIGTPQGWDGGQLVIGSGIVYTSLRNGLVCSLTANHGSFLQCYSIKNSASVSSAPTITLVD